MKKQFIDFTKVQYRQKRLAPKIVSRRMPMHAAYRSDGDGDDDDDDSEEGRKKLLKTIKGLVAKELEGRASKSEIADITKQLSFLSKNSKGEDSPFPIEALRAMADENTGVMKKLVDMGVELQKVKAFADKQVESMNVRARVQEWSEKNKTALESIKNGIKVELPALELRLASPMHTSTVNSGGSPYIGTLEVEPGVNPILVYPNTFWDFLQKGRTSAQTYVWVNKTNREGAAGFIGPGVAKPGVSFELVAESSISKKIAVSAKAGTELLQDIEGMTTFIEQDLKEQLMIEVNDKLMTGTASNTVPAGIRNLSQAFSFYTAAASGIKTKNPNFMDAVRAVVGALRSGKLTGEITVFVNSIDLTNMDISKAVDSGVYLIPPFVSQSGQVIAGAKVIEDNNIPVGYFQAGFMRYYRVLIHKDYTVSWGWENDDFTKNLVTAVGEMRLHQFFNTIHTGAFCYDTFENVKTAIAEA